MISRVAESCFWLNRYMERVEVLTRILGANASFQLDVTLPDAERWRPLVVVTGQQQDFETRTPEAQLDDPETVQRYLTWDEEQPSSILSSLRAARENARTIRETISLEMWEVLNDLWVWIGTRPAKRMYDRERHAFYLHIRKQCALFHGMALGTMLHEDPFEFMRLGTALERAGQTARILDVKYHSIGPTDPHDESPAEAAQWLATLRFCAGVEPFLKREDKPFSGRAVVEFLLFDEAFPGSVLHNLERARNFLELVRPPETAPMRQRAHGLLAEILAEFRALDVEAVLSEGVHRVVTRVVDRTTEIGAALHEDYFDPAPVFADVPLGSAQTQSQS